MPKLLEGPYKTQHWIGEGPEYWETHGALVLATEFAPVREANSRNHVSLTNPHSLGGSSVKLDDNVIGRPAWLPAVKFDSVITCYHSFIPVLPDLCAAAHKCAARAAEVCRNGMSEIKFSMRSFN